MKLRIRGNSIRLRLEQAEVKQLVETGKVEETVIFPSAQRFVYTLALDPAEQYKADFTGGTITVYLPYAAGQKWAKGEDVGIYAEVASEGLPLKLIIEKDFQCLHKRPDEDESGMFANPHASC